MWNNSAFDESTNKDAGGVGFFNEPNQLDTTQVKGKGQRRLQSVVPVVIRQLLDDPEEEFKLFGIPTQILTVVGILKNMEVQSTKAMYELEDHTGRITAVWWIETDSGPALNLPLTKEGCYLRVYGSLRTHEGQKMLMVLRMLPVDDINEITTHLLEVIHTRFEAENLSKGSGTIRKNNPGPLLANSMSFMGDDIESGSSTVTGFAPIQEKVFNILKSVNTASGLHRAVILQNFPANQHREVNTALEFLVNEGHAYSTVDNDHFRATDSM